MSSLGPQLQVLGCDAAGLLCTIAAARAGVQVCLAGMTQTSESVETLLLSRSLCTALGHFGVEPGGAELAIGRRALTKPSPLLRADSAALWSAISAAISARDIVHGARDTAAASEHRRRTRLLARRDDSALAAGLLLKKFELRPVPPAGADTRSDLPGDAPVR